MRQTKKEALDPLLLIKEINKIYPDHLLFYDYADNEINIGNIWDPLSSMWKLIFMHLLARRNHVE